MYNYCHKFYWYFYKRWLWRQDEDKNQKKVTRVLACSYYLACIPVNIFLPSAHYIISIICIGIRNLGSKISNILLIRIDFGMESGIAPQIWKYFEALISDLESGRYNSRKIILWNIATWIWDLKIKNSSNFYVMSSKTPTNIILSGYNLAVIVQTDQIQSW